MRTHILIVGKNPKYARELESAGFSVETVESRREASRLVQSHPPDLIVLEVVGRDSADVELCRTLRLTATNTSILVYAGKAREKDEIALLDAGADDLIHRPVAPALFLSRVRARLRSHGKDQEQSAELHRHDLIIDRNRYLVRRPGKDREQRIHLPRKEFELLNRLAREPGRVLSREELLDTIWGRDVYVTPRTVDVHVRKIRDKLGDSYIETVKGVGYRFREEGVEVERER